MLHRGAAAFGPFVPLALASAALAQEGARGGLGDLERRTRELRNAAEPAVVSVAVHTRCGRALRLAFPGLAIGPGLEPEERLEGSGFLVTADGHVATTWELVRRAERVEVRFADGTVRDATVLGADEPFRMAVLRTAPPERAGSLSEPRRGEAHEDMLAWFFGAAAGARGPFVQIASVSPVPEAPDAYDRWLAATLPLARGAAGGPLLDGDGRLLGMAVGSLADTAPAEHTPHARTVVFLRGDDLARAAAEIAREGRVRRPALGVFLERGGNRVQELVPGGPAERAGLVEGDAIVAVGTLAVGTAGDITRALLRRAPGERVRVHVERDGRPRTFVVTLDDAPPPPPPTVPPIPGATLRLDAAPGAEGASSHAVTFVEVAPDTPLAAAGVAAGDRLLSVDGRGVLAFLLRHRVRPQVALPSRLQIERTGRVIEIALPGE